MSRLALALGIALLSSVAWADPCEKLVAASRANPSSVEAMLEVGGCYREHAKLASAVFWLRKAQVTASERKLPDLEARAKDGTLAIASQVPSVAIRIDGATKPTVVLDGTELDATYLARIEVDAGKHELLVKAPGKQAQTTSFEITSGEQVIAMTLVDAVPRYIDTGRGQRRAAYVFGGVGLGLIVLTGVYAKIQHDKYNDPALTQVAQNEARENVRIYGTTMFLLGLAGVGTGIVLYLTAGGKEKVEDRTALVPYVAGDQAGFALSGRF